MRKIRFINIALIFIMIGLFSGCQNNTVKNENNIKEYLKEIKANDMSKIPDKSKDNIDSLVVGVKELEGIFNPIYSKSNNDIQISSVIFSNLMDTKKDGTLEPALLKEMPTISENGKVYTFILKEGLFWSDGVEITSDDIEFTYLLLCDNSYSGPAHTEDLNIKGLKEFREGINNNIEGIKIKDKYSIEISVEEGNAKTVRMLNIAPIPKHYYGEKYSRGNTKAIEELHRYPKVSSGPYNFIKWKKGDKVTLEFNDKYYKGLAKIKNLYFKEVEDDKKLELLKNGEVDIIDININEENIKKLEEMEFVDIYYYPNNGYGYIGLNLNDNSKLNNANIRKALAYGLNRKEFVEKVFGEYGEVINIPQSKVSWTYTEDNIERYDYDKEKSQKLLNDEGWIKNKNGILEKNNEEFTIKFLKTKNNYINDVLLDVAKKNYEELGIKFVIEEVDFKELRDIIKKSSEEDDSSSYDMFFMAWGLSPEPDITTIFSSQGSQNRTGYKNDKVDALLKKGLKEFNDENRKKIYKELYQELNIDLPYIYLYQRREGIAVNSRVKNIKVSPYRSFLDDIYEVYLE